MISQNDFRYIEGLELDVQLLTHAATDAKWYSWNNQVPEELKYDLQEAEKKLYHYLKKLKGCFLEIDYLQPLSIGEWIEEYDARWCVAKY